jgi:glycosyltransferase involved in cell wall biosynthesis
MANAYVKDLLLRRALGISLPEILDELRVFRFLVVATEWGVMKGGVSTFNVNLCKALARLGHSVLVAIPRDQGAAGQPERTQYDSEGIRFVSIDNPPTRNELQLFREFHPSFVVGHDRFTGALVSRLADEVGLSCKRVVFIHTDPRIELMKHESSSGRVDQREARERLQKQIMRSADIVVSVGPRLARHSLDVIRELKESERPLHMEFIPGIEMSMPGEDPPMKGDGRFRVRMFGRMEDAELKGQDLLDGAIGKLRASPTGIQEMEIAYLGGSSIDVWNSLRTQEAPDYLDRRTYTGDRTEVEEFLRPAHVVVMPSREEGFGLVAMEAIAANRPFIASSKSGFAEWLTYVAACELPDLQKSLHYFIVDFQTALQGDPAIQARQRVDRLVVTLEQVYNQYENVVEALRLLRSHLGHFGWERRCNDLVICLRSSISKQSSRTPSELNVSSGN